MSALAWLIKMQGYEVSGYDAVKSEITNRLASEDIRVDFQANFKALKDVDIVVISSAIPEDNEQVTYAKSLNKEILTRGQLLGQVASEYQNVIAVSGAHGKTTTTALIASIFMQAGKKPTVHIGGLLCENNSNLVIGEKGVFITEACEYKDNFLQLYATFGIVLNVEAEHLDYFKTFEGVKCSFRRFLSQCDNFIAPTEFGGKSLKFVCENAVEDENGLTLNVKKGGEFFGSVFCPVHGEHNIQNILTSIETADFFGIEKDDIVKGLANYRGVKRRFEKHKFPNNAKLIFDYAHHPTEIEKSIKTVKNFCKGRLIVLFQPHTYSRTKLLFSDFIRVLSGVDKVIVFMTYSARETYDELGDAKTLYYVLREKVDCEYSEDFDLLSSLKHSLRPQDILLVLGAGDFYDRCNFSSLVIE